MSGSLPSLRPPGSVLRPPSDLLVRARGEYLEMPGLSLTVQQAQRLWALDGSTCRDVLSDLVGAGFLKAREDGTYVRNRG